MAEPEEIKKLQRANQTYQSKLADVQDRYKELLRKHKRLQSDYDDLKAENDRLKRPASPHDIKARPGPRTWPV